MAQQDVNSERITRTPDITYNLTSVLYHALQGAENYEVYARDADQAGDGEAAQYFRQLVEEERRRAERTKALLKKHLG